MTVEVPEDAETASYSGQVAFTNETAATRPGRPERPVHADYVRVEVWRPPTVENVTLTLNPRTVGDTERTEEPSFNVTFVSPDGERIEAERVQVSERGFVDLGSQQRDTSDGDYSTRRTTSQSVYVLDAPETGQWTVEIMPDNTIGFQYELTRNESGD